MWQQLCPMFLSFLPLCVGRDLPPEPALLQGLSRMGFPCQQSLYDTPFGYCLICLKHFQLCMLVKSHLRVPQGIDPPPLLPEDSPRPSSFPHPFGDLPKEHIKAHSWAADRISACRCARCEDPLCPVGLLSCTVPWATLGPSSPHLSAPLGPAPFFFRLLTVPLPLPHRPCPAP